MDKNTAASGGQWRDVAPDTGAEGSLVRRPGSGERQGQREHSVDLAAGRERALGTASTKALGQKPLSMFIEL